MQNTWFVIEICLRPLTTAIMGAKLPNLSFDIFITEIFSVYMYLYLSVVQATMMLLQCMDQIHDFFSAILKINDVLLKCSHLFATWTPQFHPRQKIL